MVHRSCDECKSESKHYNFFKIDLFIITEDVIVILCGCSCYLYSDDI